MSWERTSSIEWFTDVRSDRLMMFRLWFRKTKKDDRKHFNHFKDTHDLANCELRTLLFATWNGMQQWIEIEEKTMENRFSILRKDQKTKVFKSWNYKTVPSVPKGLNTNIMKPKQNNRKICNHFLWIPMVTRPVFVSVSLNVYTCLCVLKDYYNFDEGLMDFPIIIINFVLEPMLHNVIITVMNKNAFQTANENVGNGEWKTKKTIRKYVQCTMFSVHCTVINGNFHHNNNFSTFENCFSFHNNNCGISFMAIKLMKRWPHRHHSTNAKRIEMKQNNSILS